MRYHHYPDAIQLRHSFPLDSDGTKPPCSLQLPSPEERWAGTLPNHYRQRALACVLQQHQGTWKEGVWAFSDEPTHTDLPRVSLFLDLNLPRHFQAAPMETSASCLLAFHLNFANLIQWFSVCLGNLHADFWAGKQSACVGLVGPVKQIIWNP